MSARSGLLRTRKEHEHGRVTFVELFFDLVFVFAITQLSHSFIAHFTLLGLLETTLLFMGVWWVWIFTSWVTNWLDPERTPVRLMLFALMLAGLVLSIAVVFLGVLWIAFDRQRRGWHDRIAGTRVISDA